MEYFLNFLNQYWPVIVSAFTALCSIIIFCLKKKPTTNLLSEILLKVIKVIPDFISKVECPGNGASKKNFVLNECLNITSRLLKRNLSDDEFWYCSDLFSEEIEKVLAAPQKKGVDSNVQSKENASS